MPKGKVVGARSSLEKKYCRCVSHVAAKGSAVNPYAICGASVFKGAPRRGRISCEKYLKKTGLPLVPRKKKSATKNRVNPWIKFVKDYRKKHPSLSYKEALTKAAAQYKKR